MRRFMLSGMIAVVTMAQAACATHGRSPAPAQGLPSGTGETTSAPVASGTLTAPVATDDSEWGIRERSPSQEYGKVVAKVAGMVSDADLQGRVARRGMSLVNVTWEDTGRSVGSSVGPNISDLTLQVRRRGDSGRFESALMPVIRPPNFSDRTGDVAADKFFVRVGNEKSDALTTVPLTDVLRNIRSYATLPGTLGGDGNLLAARDSHFLVSAQAVFLPIPTTGKAEFNPVLFNYQSFPGSPAVLSILVTRQGTSMRVIENRPEDGAASVGWGQELYFNAKGQRTAFTAERKSDVEARIATQGGPRTDDDKSALARGADVLFLVQVPLVQAPRPRRAADLESAAPMPAAPSAGASAKSASAPSDERDRSDVEQAVLGHGPNLGRYSEGYGGRLVRDTRFPVRITVQFYKATSNGVVSDADLDGVSRSIGGVYEHADFVGSLVLPENDRLRPTAWQNVPRNFFPW